MTAPMSFRLGRRLAPAVLTAALLSGLLVGTGVAQTVEGALDGIEQPESTGDPARDAELDARTAAIGATLRCPVCRQQSVAESSSRIAREMQGVIRTMLADGSTPDEIEAHFVEAYGPWILLKPRAEGVNLFVYLGPAVAFLLGGLFFLRRVRRDRRAKGDPATPRGSGPVETSPTAAGSADDRLSKKDRAWIDAAIRGS